MSDDVDMFITPSCVICGSALEVDQRGPEPSPQDEVRCPIHGRTGNRAEMEAAVFADHTRLQDALQEAFNKRLKDSGL